MTKTMPTATAMPVSATNTPTEQSTTLCPTVITTQATCGPVPTAVHQPRMDLRPFIKEPILLNNCELAQMKINGEAVFWYRLLAKEDARIFENVTPVLLNQGQLKINGVTHDAVILHARVQRSICSRAYLPNLYDARKYLKKIYLQITWIRNHIPTYTNFASCSIQLKSDFSIDGFVIDINENWLMKSKILIPGYDFLLQYTADQDRRTVEWVLSDTGRVPECNYSTRIKRRWIKPLQDVPKYFSAIHEDPSD